MDIFKECYDCSSYNTKTSGDELICLNCGGEFYDNRYKPISI